MVDIAESVPSQGPRSYPLLTESPLVTIGFGKAEGDSDAMPTFQDMRGSYGVKPLPEEAR